MEPRNFLVGISPKDAGAGAGGVGGFRPKGLGVRLSDGGSERDWGGEEDFRELAGGGRADGCSAEERPNFLRGREFNAWHGELFEGRVTLERAFSIIGAPFDGPQGVGEWYEFFSNSATKRKKSVPTPTERRIFHFFFGGRHGWNS